MSTNSQEGRKRTAGPRPPKPQDMDRLTKLAAEDDAVVDTSDLPSGAGHIPASAGTIRTAILRQINSLHLSPYRLWKIAQAENPKLSASQVYEYLKGERSLTSGALESLVAAAGLRVMPTAAGPGRATGRAPAVKNPARPG